MLGTQDDSRTEEAIPSNFIECGEQIAPASEYSGRNIYVRLDSLFITITGCMYGGQMLKHAHQTGMQTITLIRLNNAAW